MKIYEIRVSYYEATYGGKSYYKFDETFAYSTREKAINKMAELCDGEIIDTTYGDIEKENYAVYYPYNGDAKFEFEVLTLDED